ncbi:MAG: hypothetical protein AB1599_04850, partial [Planctomycetota bacterium]
RKDYLTAKELGFYISLFHYYDFIKTTLLTLWQKTGTNEMALLNYYERLIEFLRYRIDLTTGNDPKELSSFLFDEYYQRAISNKELSRKLRRHFDEFYTMLAREVKGSPLVLEASVA